MSDDQVTTGENVQSDLCEEDLKMNDTHGEISNE